MKRVFICSRYAGDVPRNTATAERPCREAVARGCAPFAPHLLYTRFPDDEKVKGVDIKHTTADVKNGELRVGLSGTESVTAEQISMAVQAAGVTGHLTKAKAPKTT